MWKVRVQHGGFKAYRVVRGATKEEAQLKANLQVAAWNERWGRRQAVLEYGQERLQISWDIEVNKETARRSTEELQEQLAALETILVAGLQKQPLQWNDLKDKTLFTLSHPKEPSPPQIPVKPAYPEPPDASVCIVELGLLDRAIGSRRARKEHEAVIELETAQATWRDACTAIDSVHEKQIAMNESAHTKRLKIFRAGVEAWERARREREEEQMRQHARVDALREDYRNSKAPAVEYFFAEVINHSEYPESLPEGNTLSFDENSGVLVVDFELPSQSVFPAVKEVRYDAAHMQFESVPISDAWLKKAYDDVLYQITFRMLHELYAADEAAVLKSIVFNGWVRGIDRATGIETHGCILSVQAEREEFLRINLSQVDPGACFRKLKGIASSTLIELTPVQPISASNNEDRRFVEDCAMAEALDDRTNLAAMDGRDFENLIRELFEEEFSRNGGEVRVAQMSWDSGVGAIAFDPDPIRGGKIVIQVKRHTDVVGVTAVRDLFGTVHKEGAMKGVLITTSTYGADAYEFAKGKPLTLLSGGELISLLAAHGHRAKIDLQEATAQNLQGEQQPAVES